jgi:hypothetical protein
MERVLPDTVIEELTSLPKHHTPDEMRTAAERDRADRQVRLEGGGNATMPPAQSVRSNTLSSPRKSSAP